MMMQRFFDPLVNSMYFDSRRVIEMLRQLNQTSDVTFALFLKFQLGQIIKSYEFLITETEDKVTMVNTVSVTALSHVRLCLYTPCESVMTSYI